jgi:O-antigen/teichoic acid export membrane protein
LGGASLAAYTAASSLTQKVYAVTGQMAASLLPALARIKEGVEIERLRRGVSVSLRALGFFWAALLLPLAAWGDHFLEVWLHNPALAQEAYPALLLLCVGAYFGALASGCHAALLGSGRPRLAAVTGLAAAGLGVAVAIPAIAHMGVAGAALLGLVGNLVAFVLRVAIMEKARFGRSLLPLFLEMILGLLLLTAAFYLMRLAAPRFEGLGLILTVTLMCFSAGMIAVFGLALDLGVSKFRERPSLLNSLMALRGAPSAA